MPERYGRVVAPVYAPAEDGFLQSVGSMVLIRSGDAYWTFSASHVLDRKKYRQLWLPGAPNFFQLSGKINRSKDENVVDLAYARLTETEAASLVHGGHAFLPATATTLDHSGVQVTTGACTVIGYPWKRVQPIEGSRTTFSVQAFEYKGQLASLDRLRRFGRDPEVTLMVQFDSKVFDAGEIKKRPDKEELRGVSGGAIWGRYSDNVRLLGIVHELVESRSVWLGTRCRVFPMISKGEA